MQAVQIQILMATSDLGMTETLMANGIQAALDLMVRNGQTINIRKFESDLSPMTQQEMSG